MRSSDLTKEQARQLWDQCGPSLGFLHALCQRIPEFYPPANRKAAREWRGGWYSLNRRKKIAGDFGTLVANLRTTVTQFIGAIVSNPSKEVSGTRLMNPRPELGGLHAIVEGGTVTLRGELATLFLRQLAIEGARRRWAYPLSSAWRRQQGEVE